MNVPVKPPALVLGQTIGIVAPASPPEESAFAAGVGELERIGFRVRYNPELLTRQSFFAGSHERRARELEAMLTSPEVAAVFCARGGYGTNYLLSRLDLRLLADHPKIVLGYSDVTTLLNFFRQRLGWVTFHGPMVASDFGRGTAGYDYPSLQQALMGSSSGWTIDCHTEVLREGTAEGVLLGGCLPMLTETLGTPCELDADEAILFVEDKASKPYQIDRMLMHLKLAGKLEHVRGMLFGEMLDCQPTEQTSERLQEVVRRVLDDVPGPIVFGFPSGHTSGANLTLPLGVRARLRASDRAVLEIFEPAVSPSKSR